MSPSSIVIVATLPLLVRAAADGNPSAGSVYGERIGVGVAVAILAAGAIFSMSYWIRRRRVREFRNAYPHPEAGEGAGAGAPGGLAAVENGQGAAFAWEEGRVPGAEMQSVGQKPPGYIPYRSDDPGPVLEQYPGRTYNLSGPAPALAYAVPTESNLPPPATLPAEPSPTRQATTRAAPTRFVRGVGIPAAGLGGAGRHF